MGVTMQEKYQDWIYLNYPTPQIARRACAEATLQMQEKFPELKRVRGLAVVEEPYDLLPTKTPHWWLKTELEEIIDPTAHQYPTRILSYEEADESKGPPTGKCHNCGGLCYEFNHLCSNKCSKEYIAYLKGNQIAKGYTF